MKYALILASLFFTATATQAKTYYELSILNDYLFRGITMTDHSPAIQWGAFVTNGNAYGSLQFSNVEMAEEAEGLPIEMNVHLGYDHRFNGFNIDTEIISYNTLADLGKEETEFKFGTQLSRSSYFNVYRGVKLKTWYPEYSFKKYIEKRVYLTGRIGYWMQDDTSDSALHGRLVLGMDFPEFNGFTLFVGADMITDEAPGNDNEDDDDHAGIVFGFTKRF